MILQKFMEEGYYERHLNKTRALYKNRHDVLISSLRKMKEILERSDEQVYNAAIMSGFNESTNINRVFKASTGYSPREYRLIHKKGAD